MRRVRFKAVCLTLLCMMHFPSFAKDGPDGLKQTENLYATLSEYGYSCSLQPLTDSSQQTFPQNIIVTIPPVSVVESEIKSTVFAFTQDFAESYPDFIKTFLDSLKTLDLTDQVQVLFSADEADFSFLRGQTCISGTEVYALNLEDEDSICAVVFEPAKKGLSVFPGSSSKVSPLWLSQAVTLCAQNLKISIDFPANMMLLYRLGLLDAGERLNWFLGEDVPSLQINGEPVEQNALYLAGLAYVIEQKRSSQWDSHYTALKLGDALLWINETLFVLAHIILVAIMLVTLAFSNFASSSANRAMIKDFKRTWFILPLTVILTALLLEIFGAVFYAVKNPITAFILKTVLTCTAMWTLLGIQIKKRYRLSFRVLGYETVLMAALSLVLFSFLDISFVFAFLFIYIVAFVSRKFKSPSAIITCTVLTVLPFVPYFVRIILYADFSRLTLFSRSTFGQNFLYACVLFLFITFWERIVISLKILVDETHDTKKFAMRLSLTVLISSLSLALLLFLPSLILQSRRPKDSSLNAVTVRDAPEKADEIILEYDESSFMSLCARHLNIHSEADVYRYEIYITSPTSEIPIYESDTEYFLDEEKTARFRLPDWPESDLEILYSADRSTANIITVEAYIHLSDGTFQKVTKTLEIDGEDA